MSENSDELIIKGVKDIYNSIAKMFSSTRSFAWDDLELLKKYVRDGDKVADIGCGNGRLFQVFADLNIAYQGVDISEELIKIAQEKFAKAKFSVGDMRSLSFTNEYFDNLFCIAALQHLPDETSRLRALEEFKRLVKNGGKIVLLNWNLYSAWAKKKYGEGKNGDFEIDWKNGAGQSLGKRYYHGFNLSELAELVKKSGLQVVEQYYMYNGQRSDIVKAKNILTICAK